MFLSLSFIGCASEPKADPIDLNFAFCEVIPTEELWACLKKEDVFKLRKKLYDCQMSGGEK
jgi:hypothetical protein